MYHLGDCCRRISQIKIKFLKYTLLPEEMRRFPLGICKGKSVEFTLGGISSLDLKNPNIFFISRCRNSSKIGESIK